MSATIRQRSEALAEDILQLVGIAVDDKTRETLKFKDQLQLLVGVIEPHIKAAIIETKP